MALVAQLDWDWRPELIGVATYDALEEEEDDRNRIAIQDYWQGRGRGPILLDEILRADEAQGPPSGASLTSPMKWTPW